MIIGTPECPPTFTGPEEQTRPRRSLLSRLFWGAPREMEEPATLEQRERQRHAITGSAKLTELDGHGMPGRSWPVEIINLSKGGAALSTAIFIAPGTPVMIQFAAADNAPPKHLMAKVIHIRRMDELAFAVGIRFDARGRGGGR